MEILKAVWKFFDGKKVAIAWVLGVLPSAPFVPASWHETLIWFSVVIGGGGMVHKFKKGELKKKPGK